jgi:NDP-sugar pyrophosphorylase family protein
VNVDYICEPEGVGVAGGLLAHRERIMAGLDEDSVLLLLHGDTLSTFPLAEMIETHISSANSTPTPTLSSTSSAASTSSSSPPSPDAGSGSACSSTTANAEGTSSAAVITMMTREVDSRAEDPRHYGCLVTEPGATHNAVVKHYVEKPDTFVSAEVNCGAYVISPAPFFVHTQRIHTRLLTEEPDAYQLLQARMFLSLSHSSAGEPQDPHISLERHVFPALVAEQSLHAFKFHGWWTQVKTPK